MDPAGGDIPALDEFTLILAESLLIVSVRSLEPGAGSEQVEVNGILLVRLKVQAIEEGLVIPNIMHGRKFRRIEIAARACGVGGNEVAPFLSAIAESKVFGRGAERTVSKIETAEGLRG